MFLRGTVYWCQDNETGKQESLRTKDRAEAERLFNAKNEAHQQPIIYLQIARAYLMVGDPEVSTRGSLAVGYPCIALVDLRMPGIDGFTVIETIAKNPRHTNVLLVAVTAYDLEAIRRAYQCGAQTSLSKPPNPVEIRNFMEFFSSHWVIENPAPDCE